MKLQAFLGSAILAVACCNVQADEEPVFMFVQTTDDMQADPEAQTLRLVNVYQQTVFFSDRPERIAGHLKMDAYLQEWILQDDNFDEDPPNASVSVYEPGPVENTVAIVELTNPVVDGADLVYNYTLLDGDMPLNGGQTTLFIGAMGIGGGVGVGYHGVGVGRRGPGVR